MSMPATESSWRRISGERTALSRVSIIDRLLSRSLYRVVCCDQASGEVSLASALGAVRDVDLAAFGVTPTGAALSVVAICST